MPHNDKEADATMQAHMPQDLVDAVKKYGTVRRQTVSEVLRDAR